MSLEEKRLSRLAAFVLDDLDWQTLVKADRGEIQIVPRRAGPYSPIIEGLRSVSTEFVVIFPRGDGPALREGDGELMDNEWEIIAVLGERRKPVTWVDDTWSDSDVLVKLGDALQDALLEFTTEPCPPCPLHHSHPLNAVELENDARWLCPIADAAWSCRVGEYKSSARLVSEGRRSKRQGKSSPRKG